MYLSHCLAIVWHMLEDMAAEYAVEDVISEKEIHHIHADRHVAIEEVSRYIVDRWSCAEEPCERRLRGDVQHADPAREHAGALPQVAVEQPVPLERPAFRALSMRAGANSSKGLKLLPGPAAAHTYDRLRWRDCIPDDRLPLHRV